MPGKTNSLEHHYSRGFPRFAAAVVAAALAVSVLTGCGGPNSAANTAQAHMAACDAYAATLHSLAAWRAAGELSAESVATVDALRPRLNAICDGQTASTLAIVTEFNAALTALIIIQSRGN